MRKIYRTLLCGSLLLFSLGFSSCEDYLDKEADSTVSEEEALHDMDQKIKSGEILRYILLN